MPAPTSAELLEMSKTAIQRAEKAESALKSLQDKVEATPSIHAHGSRDNGAEGWWEEAGADSPELTMLSGYQGRVPQASPSRGSMKKSMSILKSIGYRPAGRQVSTFKSISDWIRQGMQKDGEGTAKFLDNMYAHMKEYDSQMKALGMSEGIASDGGFGVIPEFNLKIHEHLYSNNILSRTDGYTVTGNNMAFLANAETSRVTGSRAGGIQGNWVGEGGTYLPSKPTVRQINLRLQKLQVLVYLTDELINDNSIALEQYVMRKASEEFAWLIADAIFNGNNVGKPLGIQNALSLLAIAKESGQADTTIVAQNIIKMQNRLFAPYMQNASWFVNQDTIQQLMQLTLATGTYSGQLVYQPPTGLAGLPYGTLGGRPVEPIEFAKTLGTQGDITLADLSQVLSISKGGIEQATSMHVAFLTDEMALRFTMRMNAMPWENSPITPANGTNTQSSFVTLASRP